MGQFWVNIKEIVNIFPFASVTFKFNIMLTKNVSNRLQQVGSIVQTVYASIRAGCSG